jgi:hypothetical protein
MFPALPHAELKSSWLPIVCGTPKFSSSFDIGPGAVKPSRKKALR